jgi:hypothetical protein
MDKKPTLGVALLCFNNERALEKSLRELLSLDFSPFRYLEIHVFNPGYPLANKSEYSAICRRYGAKEHVIENLGQTINIKESVPHLLKFDYVLGWEPDSVVDDKLYLTTCVDLCSRFTDVEYVVPKHVDWVYDRQGQIVDEGKHSEGRIITFQGGWPQTFYTQKAWAKLENIKPSCVGHYGGTEYDIWAALQPFSGIMLKNICDKVDQSLYDKSYKTWKETTIGKPNQKPYKDYL